MQSFFEAGLRVVDYGILFFLYSAIGWLVESIYVSVSKGHWVNRGFLNGPICPVYGTGAILIILLLTPLKEYPPLVFLTSLLVVSIVEYVTAWILETIFHAKWWDYSNKRFNIKGRVCLLNALEFGVLGLALMYGIHPCVTELLGRISVRWHWIILAVIVIAFVFDLVFSTRTALRLRGDMANSRKWREDLEKLLESLPKPEVIRNLEERWEQASEEGRQWLEQVKQRLAEYRSAEEEQRKRKQNRLLRAFPNLSQSKVEMAGRLSELRNRLEGWLKEHGRETGDSREDEKKG
ncbi:putative ABC transporter permease [Bianquea renquensis]|uniref:Uncharacterized protein n=1 Tax=Bianquea renquensis TaxID=2763661 RepID=A0A926I2H7_9FIRM|nr:putative ABC transporter permease [Bianquea renquensis]MBC8544071.1 hypothetical protein [Bianquea renquensis]